MSFVKSIPVSEESVSAVMQRYPDQGLPMARLTEIIMRTGVCQFSAKERELIGAFASGTNACIYCFNTHKVAAEAFGVDENLLQSLLDDVDSSPVDDRLKPVLRYVKKLTETPSRMVQADANAIFEAGWDEDSFHFTVMICALFNFYNRLIDGYGVRNTAEFRLTAGKGLADSGYGIVAEAMKQ
jgi:uncharacterized peroxidase-related enzyme